MPRETQICGHPELWPEDGEKPAACEMRRLCECGENQCCPVCGWGFGALPCSCQRARLGLGAGYGNVTPV